MPSLDTLFTVKTVEVVQQVRDHLPWLRKILTPLADRRNAYCRSS